MRSDKSGISIWNTEIFVYPDFCKTKKAKESLPRYPPSFLMANSTWDFLKILLWSQIFCRTKKNIEIDGKFFHQREISLYILLVIGNYIFITVTFFIEDSLFNTNWHKNKRGFILYIRVVVFIPFKEAYSQEENINPGFFYASAAISR